MRLVPTCKARVTDEDLQKLKEAGYKDFEIYLTKEDVANPNFAEEAKLAIKRWGVKPVSIEVPSDVNPEEVFDFAIKTLNDAKELGIKNVVMHFPSTKALNLTGLDPKQLSTVKRAEREGLRVIKEIMRSKNRRGLKKQKIIIEGSLGGSKYNVPVASSLRTIGKAARVADGATLDVEHMMMSVFVDSTKLWNAYTNYKKDRRLSNANMRNIKWFLHEYKPYLPNDFHDLLIKFRDGNLTSSELRTFRNTVIPADFKIPVLVKKVKGTGQEVARQVNPNVEKWGYHPNKLSENIMTSWIKTLPVKNVHLVDNLLYEPIVSPEYDPNYGMKIRTKGFGKIRFGYKNNESIGKMVHLIPCEGRLWKSFDPLKPLRTLKPGKLRVVSETNKAAAFGKTSAQRHDEFRNFVMRPRKRRLLHR